MSDYAFHDQKKQLLIVEDDKTDFYILVRTLQQSAHDAYEIDTCTTIKDAERKLSGKTYSAVIIDLNLDDVSGLDAVRRVVNVSADVAIIVLTGHYEERLARDAIALGAQDFLAKEEISTRLLCRVLDHSIQRKSAENALAIHASVDPLTKLLNRRSLDHAWHNLCAKTDSNNQSVLGVYVDINGLKTLNDTHGHTHGDKLIAAVAERLCKALPKTSIVARLGGDEFFCIILEGDCVGAPNSVADAINMALDEPIEGLPEGYRPSVSIGIHKAASIQCLPIQTLIDKADVQMYKNKHKQPWDNRVA